MSDTKQKSPPLSEEQRAWANAFINLMGGTTFGKPTRSSRGRGSKTQGPGLRGKLEQEQKGLGAPTLGRSGLTGDNEAVGRKKGILSSSDKGFRTNVSDVVDAFIEEVDDLIAGGPGPEIAKRVETLRGKLEEQRVHYEESLTKKDSKEKTEQRQRKILAIDQRLSALDLFEADLEHAAQERVGIVGQLDDTERAQALLDNPEIRRGVIASRPRPDQLAKMFAATNSKKQDDLLKEILDIHGKDQGYLLAVAREATTLVTANDQRGNYMRGNSSASKLLRDICLQGEDTQKMAKGVRADAEKWAKSAGLIEVNVTALESLDEHARNDIIVMSVQALGELVKATLQRIYDTELPGEMKATAKIAADQFLRKFPDASPKELSAIVSGHIFLRIISPAMTEGATAMSPKLVELEKKKKKASPEYKLLKQQQDAIMLAARVLQNAGNGTLPGNSNPVYKPLDGLITEILDDMQEYCLSVIA